MTYIVTLLNHCYRRVFTCVSIIETMTFALILKDYGVQVQGSTSLKDNYFVMI